jgi:hypothetical protein
MNNLSLLLASFALLLIAACSGKDAPADPDLTSDLSALDGIGELGGGDGAGELRGDGLPGDLDEGDASPIPLGPYAAVLQSAEDGIMGIDSVGRKGDLVIGNGKLVAVIGGMDHSIWGPYGGGVLDLSVPGGEDGFEEMFATAGFLRGVRASSIEVVSDGSNGEAMIRVTGKDGPVPLVAAVVPTPPAGIDVVVEYVLDTDSNCLEIRTTVTNPSGNPIKAPVGDGLVFSEVGRTFGAVGGFDIDKVIAAGDVDFLGSDVATVSYLMAPASGKSVTVALSEEELNAVTYETLSLDPGESRTSKRCLYAASGRSIAVLERYWEDRKIPTVDVAGSIDIKTPGYDFSQVALDVTDGNGGFFGSAQPDAEGMLRFRLPVGSYSVTVSGPGLETFVVPLDAVATEEGRRDANGEPQGNGDLPQGEADAEPQGKADLPQGEAGGEPQGNGDLPQGEANGEPQGKADLPQGEAGGEGDRAWQGVLLELDPPDPGRIDVQIEDGEGKPVPSRIMAFPGADPGMDPPRLALRPDLEGKATLFLPAGEYTIQGSRGPEWSYCRAAVEVASGEAVKAGCSIARELDVAGWYPGDMHTHSEFSIDSQMRRHVRVASEMAEGMAFWVATEHDVFADYAPVVEALGLTGTILPSVGNEVSPVGRHFNGLGCTPSAEQKQKYFVVPWVSFTDDGEVAGFRPAPAVWKSMHEDFGCTVVQINHPRDGQGYFDFAKYDPAVGPSSAKPGELDLTFDAIEVWNAGNDRSHLEEKTLPDWYSFLNRGHRKLATGNADTHDLSQWVGQPRNLVPVEGALTEAAYYESLLGSRSQVTSAPLIELTLDGQGLGATVTPATPGGPVTAALRVSAVSWAPLSTVRLIGNGELVQEWDVSGEKGLVRLDTTVELSPQVDTWYHVTVFDAGEGLAPVYPGRTSGGLSNPIWVDLDGDGFDSPLKD